MSAGRAWIDEPRGRRRTMAWGADKMWKPGCVVTVLLGLRFVLELALFTTIGVLGARLSTAALLSWALALGMVSVTVVIWGVLLSPRRRIDLPLHVRAGLELALFGVAAFGLAWTGHLTWAWVLLVSEVIVLVALWVLGLPPGSDAANPRRGGSTPVDGDARD